MELVTHKKFKGDKLMPWGKGTVVSGAKGTVYLCGSSLERFRRVPRPARR